jgi:hypothetical protein
MRTTWIALAVLTLTACSGGPYSELESKFASVNAADSPPIPTTTLVLVGKKHRGAYNYKKTMAIRLLANAVEIEPTGPLALTMKPVRVPRDVQRQTAPGAIDAGHAVFVESRLRRCSQAGMPRTLMPPSNSALQPTRTAAPSWWVLE